MNKETLKETRDLLYKYTSRAGEEQIETSLTKDEAGRLDLVCERKRGGESESVRLTDLGRREEDCLLFARTVADSHTYPRILPELWEEFAR